MEVDEIRRIIEDQEASRKEMLKNKHIIEREADKDRAETALSGPNILAILGIRRCGKSVFSWLTFGKLKYAYINFDDEAFYGIKTEDLNKVLKAFYLIYGDASRIILDEIQNVPGWELFATRLRNTKRVIITGSNSQLLSGELATHLTGRHIDMTLFPFSFREFVKYKSINLDSKSYSTMHSVVAETALKEYMKLGGFPEAYELGSDIISSILNDIVTKDVVKRHNIRNISSLEGMVHFLISNSTKEITYNSLINSFGIRNIATIRNYIKYLEEAYLLFQVERTSFKLKRSIAAPRKVYAIDTSIISAVHPDVTDRKGVLMENIVAVDLLRRKTYWNRRVELYYWKDYSQKEVDFVLKEKGRIKQLIQVSYDIKEESTKKRETNSLIKASRELKCNNLLVITWDYEGVEKIGGKVIKYTPLWKWLLKI